MLVDDVEAQASPIARQTIPPATTSFVPRCTASLVPSTEVIPVMVATGRSLTPVESGEYPFRNWK